MNIKFKDVCDYLNALQVQKGKSYGSMDDGEQESWNKEGEIGAYFTVKRKLDRLEKAIKGAMAKGALDGKFNILQSELEGEALIDTLADAAVYFTKWVQWYANELDPSGFDNWMIQNRLPKNPYSLVKDEN